MKFRHVGAAALFLVLGSGAADAHFRLLAPASWIEENQLGDPQKAAPCGGTNTDFGTPTEALMGHRDGYFEELEGALKFLKPSFNEDMRAGHTNM